jgi:hypothetical protein
MVVHVHNLSTPDVRLDLEFQARLGYTSHHQASVPPLLILLAYRRPFLHIPGIVLALMSTFQLLFKRVFAGNHGFTCSGGKSQNYSPLKHSNVTKSAFL